MKRYLFVLFYLSLCTANAQPYARGYYFPQAIQNRYTPAHYIESTGTQYIDTKLTFSKGTRFVFKTYWDHRIQTMFGANSAGNEVMFGYASANTAHLGGIFDYHWQFRKDYDIDLDLENTGDNLILAIDGETIRNVSGDVNNKQVYLFAALNRTEDTKPTGTAQRYYNFTAYHGNDIIMNLIPVYDTVDKVYGMYDVVNETFLNNQGTGNFLGEPLPCTNAPANAHYTGDGTNNDCPWECDDGYWLTPNNTCEKLCDGGMTQICTNFGCTKLYANRVSSPTLCIKETDTICYGRLMPGRVTGKNLLHININGTVYHLAD